MIKICHIITTLGTGGAERLLESFIESSLDDYEHLVVYIKGPDELSENLRSLGVKVIQLTQKKSFFYTVNLEAINAINTFAPDITHCWMYHAMLANVLLRPFLGTSKLVWSVHAYGIVPKITKTSTYFVIKFLSILSYGFPLKITYCGVRTASNHEKLWFAKSKRFILPNGIDISKFHFSIQQRESLRKSLKIDTNAVVIGCVARRAPEKNHEMLIKVAKQLIDINDNVYFVFYGRGLDASSNLAQNTLKTLTADTQKRILFLGEAKELANIYSAMDIHVLPSRSESFPLVLLEAMANEVYCIATRVGECESILGNFGTIVEIDDTTGLEKELSRLILMDSSELAFLKGQSKQNVELNFTLEKFRNKLVGLYGSILEHE